MLHTPNPSLPPVLLQRQKIEIGVKLDYNQMHLKKLPSHLIKEVNMKKFSILLIFLCLCAMTRYGFAAQANTIDELASMVSIEKCAECHEDIHDQWASSLHSKSLTDSRVIRVWRTFILSGLDKKGMPRTSLKFICLSCHAPQATIYGSDQLIEQIASLIVTAADDPDQSKRQQAVAELSKLNVNCIICHNLKGAKDGKPQPKTIYGPEDPEDVPHKEEFGFETVKSDFLKTSEYCAQCHHGCPPGMSSKKCPTQYTSYKEHYLAKGGDKTCQQCHMPVEDEMISHRFPGAEDPEFAKTGIELRLYVSPTQYAYHLENRIVPGLIIDAGVKNKAGHIMPHG